jgi:hypothetical protein
MVNRTWAQLFARGLVEPVDGMGDGDDGTHPELFRALVAEFRRSGFDLKHLVRGICNSRAYQRTSAGEGSAGDGLYARMAIKPFTPEQLYDSLSAVLGTKTETAKGKEARKAAKVAANKYGPKSPRARFVAFFDTPDGADPTEYATGIPQILHLMNAPEMDGGAALLDDALGRGPAQAVDRLYLATLARHPTRAERQRVGTFLKSGRPSREALSDLLWVLLNTSEFTLNH